MDEWLWLEGQVSDLKGWMEGLFVWKRVCIK